MVYRPTAWPTLTTLTLPLSFEGWHNELQYRPPFELCYNYSLGIWILLHQQIYIRP